MKKIYRVVTDDSGGYLVQYQYGEGPPCFIGVRFDNKHDALIYAMRKQQQANCTGEGVWQSK